MGVTSQLAEFVADHSFSNLPNHVVDLAKYTIIDTLGCCIAGWSEAKEEREWIMDLVQDLGGKPESSIFMSGMKTSPALAALANGTMIHSIDFDDTHMGSISHFSASLVPTVFSLGERVKADGKKLIEAFVVGFEVGGRVGRYMMPSHYKFWHPTSTFGSLASAAAASKLLNLDGLQTEFVLGLAADMAAGLRYCIDKGDYSKSLHPGFSAMRGVIMALLIKTGANGPRGILEYPTGFCYAMCEEPKINCIAEDLGKTYEITSNTLKAYPTILISHGCIQGILEIQEQEKIDFSQVKKIHLIVSQTAKGQGQNYDPETPLAARLSIPFCVALALIDGKVSLTQFTKKRLADPKVKNMMKNIEIESDASLNRKYPETLAAVVSLETKNKESVRREVIYPKGSVKNPMTREDVIGKFRTLATMTVSSNQCDRILELLLRLEEMDSPEELLDLLRG